MKLDRNSKRGGVGKYIVINTRKLGDHPLTDAADVIRALMLHPEAIEIGGKGDANEFFVLKLKDQFAEDALSAYARQAYVHDKDLASDVSELARRAATHPNRHFPD